MILAIVALVIVVVAMAVAWFDGPSGGRASGTIFAGFISSLVLSALAFIVLGLFMHLGTTGSVNNLVSKYEDNIEVCREAIQAVREGVERSVAPTLIEGANLKQIEAFSEVVTECRDDVTFFNSRLRSHRYWQDSALFGWYWKNIPDHLEPLSLDIN